MNHFERFISRRWPTKVLILLVSAKETKRLTTAAIALCILIVSTTTSASGQSIRVMSYNIMYEWCRHGSFPRNCTNPSNQWVRTMEAIRWENRKFRVFSAIEEFNPDILGLEEMRGCQVDAVAGRSPAIVSDVRSRLGRSYSQRFAGKPESPGDCRTFRTWLFFRTRRFVEKRGGSFPQDPSAESNHRQAVWSELQDLDTGQQFIAAVVHLNPRHRDTRFREAQHIIATLSQLARGIPIILMGDCNFSSRRRKDWAIYSVFTKTLVDSYVSVHGIADSRSSTIDLGTGDRGKQRIDYIFVSRDFAVLAANIDSKPQPGPVIDTVYDFSYRCPRPPCAKNGPQWFGSDHLPVTATVALGNRSKASGTLLKTTRKRNWLDGVVAPCEVFAVTKEQGTSCGKWDSTRGVPEACELAWWESATW